jgi:alpha,alpha-trehalase
MRSVIEDHVPKSSLHSALRRILLTLALAASWQAHAQQFPDPPQVLFQDLYSAVEMEHVFADSKEFADAVPKSPPAEILELYHSQKPRSPAELKRFVEEHFDLPQPALDLAAPATALPIEEHINALWDHLEREARTPPPYSSLVPLPRPFVVPGARFRELYYWDSYFVMLGLAESGRKDLLQDMVANFAYLIDTYGHIPNGNRTYYLTRSQPPFFFKMVGLLAPDDEAAAFARYLPQLKKEYAFWMDDAGAGAEKLRPGTAHRRVVALSDGSVLNRYWDDRDMPRDESYREDVTLARSSRRDPRPLYHDIRAAAESGWDFSSRWFADGRNLSTIDTVDVIPADLNSLLFGLENAIRSGCERAGDHACALDFSRRAAARRAAADKYLWDEAAGSYLDYNYRRRKRIARVSAATLYPLFVGMAGDRQAARIAAITARQLVKPGGLAATTIDTGQQWDSPNGWAPLQWIAIVALRRYGHAELAEEIACRWMVNVSRAYQRSGKLVEKYDVISPDRPGRGGEYPLQDGFGWTNGVMMKLMALYPKDTAYSDVSSCPSQRASLGRSY